jgi:hypothetical protein
LWLPADCDGWLALVPLLTPLLPFRSCRDSQSPSDTSAHRHGLLELEALVQLGKDNPGSVKYVYYVNIDPQMSNCLLKQWWMCPRVICASNTTDVAIRGELDSHLDSQSDLLCHSVRRQCGTHGALCVAVAHILLRHTTLQHARRIRLHGAFCWLSSFLASFIFFVSRSTYLSVCRGACFVRLKSSSNACKTSKNHMLEAVSSVQASANRAQSDRC